MDDQWLRLALILYLEGCSVTRGYHPDAWIRVASS